MLKIEHPAQILTAIPYGKKRTEINTVWPSSKLGPVWLEHSQQSIFGTFPVSEIFYLFE